jgi:hypothetical protein
MISVIMPLGQRQRSSTFWLARGASYIVASTVAGALVGAGVGWLGSLARLVVPFAAVLVVVVLLAIAYALHESGILQLPRPERRWQVPNAWAVRWPILGVVAFGLTIGAGIFTFIPFTSFYVLLAWELLLANPWAGALLGAAYGLARGLPVITGAVITGRGGLIAPIHLIILNASANIHRITAALLVVLAVGLTIPFLLGL